VLVVADAGQLEPRVLAAMSRDRGLVAATRQGDLYAALAAEALGRPEARADAKLGMLSAMYGGGAGSPALAALRRRFPAALELLEDAARTGEDGGSVRSVLGRASPPAADGWLDGPGDEAAGGRRRAYGRFTRNFVARRRRRRGDHRGGCRGDPAGPRRRGRARAAGRGGGPLLRGQALTLWQVPPLVSALSVRLSTGASAAPDGRCPAMSEWFA